jgi:hypothetical protein
MLLTLRSPRPRPSSRKTCHGAISVNGRDAESVLRRDAIRIAQFESDPELGLLVIDKE